MEARSSSRRDFWVAVVVAPSAIALVLLAADVVSSSTSTLPACWILPNSHTAAAPPGKHCDLAANERITPVEGVDAYSVLPVVREDGSRADVPVVVLSSGSAALRIMFATAVAGFLLAIPVLLLRRSGAMAALPFALLYSAVALVAVAYIAGRSSAVVTRGSLVAMLFLPALLAHVALTFPRERVLVRESPDLQLLPYALCLLLLPAGWFAFDRYRLLWPAFTYLLILLTAGSWLILLASCAFAVRESISAIERERARIVFYGAILLPIAPAAFLGRSSDEPFEMLTAYLWAAAITMPLPIGLAVSRYNLFDLRSDVRRAVGRFVYLTTVAGAATLVLGLMSPHVDPFVDSRSSVFVFLAVIVSVSLIEAGRLRTRRYLESRFAPRSHELRTLRGPYEREMAELHEEDDVARRLGEALRAGLRPTGGCVFLASGKEWRPAHLFGMNTACSSEVASEASAAIGSSDLLHLAQLAEHEIPDCPRLLAAGAEVIARIDSGVDQYGLLVLSGSERGTPYAGVELDFVKMATSHAGIALRNARLTADLVAAERHATTGRVAVALAHEIGKELDWMSQLVERLPKRLDDRPRLERDVAMIGDFTAGLVESMRDFIKRTAESAEGVPGVATVDELVDMAIRKNARIHGEGRYTRSIDPAARTSRCDEIVGHVIATLIDNGLRASSDSGSVHVFATVEDGGVRIVVSDQGEGIPDSLRDRIFEAGFTTRRAEGGLGIGLTVSREILVGLGGSLDLSPGVEGGTRATVRVPRHAAPC